jgi:CBS-domain-containing membrane protein
MRLNQQHHIRRMPVIDGEDRCIGIVSQADLALKEKPEKVIDDCGGDLHTASCRGIMHGSC